MRLGDDTEPHAHAAADQQVVRGSQRQAFGVGGRRRDGIVDGNRSAASDQLAGDVRAVFYRYRSGLRPACVARSRVAACDFEVGWGNWDVVLF